MEVSTSWDEVESALGRSGIMCWSWFTWTQLGRDWRKMNVYVQPYIQAVTIELCERKNGECGWRCLEWHLEAGARMAVVVANVDA